MFNNFAAKGCSNLKKSDMTLKDFVNQYNLKTIDFICFPKL